MNVKEKRAKVLIVDDEKIHIDILVGLLNPYYHTIAAKNGEMVFRRIEKRAQPDLILLDIMMPTMNGFEVCRRLKDNQKTADIPVIFISALSDSFDKVKAFEAGAVDYVTKPFFADEVLARVDTHLCLRSAQRNLEIKNRELKQLNRRLSESNYKLKKTQQELFYASKMASLGTLSAGVAHAINNGITAIDRSFDTVIKKNIEFTETYKKLLDLLDAKKRERVNKIAAEILGFAKTHLPLDTKQIRKNGLQIQKILKKQGKELSIMDSKKLASYRYHEENVHELFDILKAGDTKVILKFFDINYSMGNSLQNVTIGKDRIKSIVSAITEYGHPGKNEKTKIDVNHAIDKVLFLMHNQLKYGIEIEKNYQSDLPKPFVKAEELYEIFTNLIINAVHAMDGNGKIIIATCTRQSDENDYICIEISDTGHGIPDNIKEKIFEPFFTTKDVGEGTGLGLSIVNKIVQGLNGKIDAYNGYDGAVFEVSIPYQHT
ncbi:response regulator [Desulfococcaceae bacterium HSG7]|nr:response regulator [Desulfococcaceae bacterium HSG7]